MTERKRPRVIHIKEASEFPDALYVGRQNGWLRLSRSKWHNPFKVGGPFGRTLDEALESFELHMTAGEGRKLDLSELTGRDLACWCRRSTDERTDENRCHADILIELWEKQYGDS